MAFYDQTGAGAHRDRVSPSVPADDLAQLLQLILRVLVGVLWVRFQFTDRDDLIISAEYRNVICIGAWFCITWVLSFVCSSLVYAFLAVMV